MSEYVYCITNPLIENVSKCGGSSRLPENRCRELSNTSLPLKNKLEYFIIVNNWRKAEKYIHDKLSENGIERFEGREWFKCRPNEIKYIFNECKKIYGINNINDIKDKKTITINNKNISIKNKIFECKICNYSTEVKSNINRHNKSEKHLEKIKNNIEISKNNNSSNSLQKENNELKEQLNNYKLNMETLKKEYELKIQQKDIEIQQKEIEKLESINKILIEHKTINTYNKININSHNNSAHSYVVDKFKEAPPLKKIDNFKIDGLDPNNKEELPKFIDNIIYSSKNKSLDSLLGNHLVKIYKKNNLEEQSFHSTDVSRLNYIVKLTENLLENYESSEEENTYNNSSDDEDDLKELEIKYKKDIKEKEYNEKIYDIENNNDDYWYIDKHGHKISRLVIEPLLRKLIKIFRNKIQAYLEETKRNIKETFGKTEIENIEILQNILQELDSGKLKKDINKFIASKFFIDNKIKKPKGKKLL